MQKFISNKKQQGFSILAFMIGAIVVIGIVSYLGSTVYNAIVSGNQRINLSTQSDQTLIQSAYILSTETTRNGSGIPISNAILTNSFSPSGGGIIPTASAAIKFDPYGSNIGYCVNPTPAAQADPVFAIISAGANKTFNTTCTQALAGTSIGDDKVIVKSVANILQGVGGTVFFRDPVATVADLANISAATIKPGQMCIVKADSSVYINATGIAGAANWKKVSSDSGTSVSGTNDGFCRLYIPTYNNYVSKINELSNIRKMDNNGGELIQVGTQLVQMSCGESNAFMTINNWNTYYTGTRNLPWAANVCYNQNVTVIYLECKKYNEVFSSMFQNGSQTNTSITNGTVNNTWAGF